MVLLGLTDTHGNTFGLDALHARGERADVLLLAGDITHFGTAADAEHMVRAAARLAPVVLAVSGNCDPPEVEQYLDASGRSLHGRGRTVDGVGFFGAGGSLSCPGAGTPNECGEAALADALARGWAMLEGAVARVLVVHQPPHGTSVDRVVPGAHVGSRAVRRFLETQPPALCLTGHIHEAAGIDWLNGTPLVNPGPARGGGYLRAELGPGRPVRVELRGLGNVAGE